MSEAKFTPGPWEFRYDEGGKESEIDSAMSNYLSEPIAVIPHDDMTEEGEVEMLANAHLIEAAPMLYSALDAIVKYPNPQHNTELWIRAREALAKARGEE